MFRGSGGPSCTSASSGSLSNSAHQSRSHKTHLAGTIDTAREQVVVAQISSSQLAAIQLEAVSENSHQTTPAPGPRVYHRRHPAEHPRRLANHPARWGEPPVNGICRWCYERTAHIKTRWHPYCLNVYRVASGQHPEEIRYTLCEMCGDRSYERDNRLSIEVARTLGPAVMLRAFPPDNLHWLHWLCRSCHRRKTRQDRLLAKFLAAYSLDWHGA